MKSRKKILLGVSSGIAAYKVLELISLLRLQEVDVTVMMTPNATRMISVKDFEERSGHQVLIELFPESFDYKKILKTRTVEHIELADSADLIAIVPATANTIGKLAHGLADDFMTTTLLAASCPVYIFPSMNVHMWNNPAVKDNIAAIKRNGLHVIDPDSGPLACGYEGKGRLPDVKEISTILLRALDLQRSLRGKKIVVTAGGTEEAIDAVRVISNRSSGKMGASIADACYELGATVQFIHSRQSVLPQYTLSCSSFTTTNDLRRLMQEKIIDADIIFHAAAVSDFVPNHMVDGKLSSKQTQHIDLVPQTKIVDSIKEWNPSVVLIAFKAEYGITNETMDITARERLKETQANAIIVNDVSQSDRGFQSDNNEVCVVTDAEVIQIPFASKRVIAQNILETLIHRHIIV